MESKIFEVNADFTVLTNFGAKDQQKIYRTLGVGKEDRRPITSTISKIARKDIESVFNIVRDLEITGAADFEDLNKKIQNSIAALCFLGAVAKELKKYSIKYDD